MPSVSQVFSLHDSQQCSVSVTFTSYCQSSSKLSHYLLLCPFIGRSNSYSSFTLTYCRPFCGHCSCEWSFFIDSCFCAVMVVRIINAWCCHLPITKTQYSYCVLYYDIVLLWMSRMLVLVVYNISAGCMISNVWLITITSFCFSQYCHDQLTVAATRG